jgi:hypothetical protein
MKRYTDLGIRHALPWATAQVNTLVYVTAEFLRLTIRDASLRIPYKRDSVTGRP